MNKIFFILFSIINFWSFSQSNVSGKVVDKNSNETLIGANIVLEGITGSTADFNGEFEFNNIPNGSYSISASYAGYETEKVSFNVQNSDIDLVIRLKSTTLDIIEIIGDVAEFRKTPVSLSTVKIDKIQNELAGQEMPTLLNSTPGVYTTQQGGGDGDIRINIRGFNQRNVAVMIDGIPMNDMENGWVYWANWFGLDVITASMQVQRGLGASKLALPSVGGTINIITKGVGAKEGGKIKQEIGSGGYLRTSFGFTSKESKLGTFNYALSLKRSNGIIDETFSEGFFYYLKWQKQINNHLFSLTTFGAPQEHGQRKYQTGASIFDKNFATQLGIDTSGLEGNYGLNYNPNWGNYNNYQVVFDENNNPSDTLWGNNYTINQHKNYYHKPNFSFQHLWEINDKTSMTNILYYSLGNGGGTSLSPSLNPANYTEDHQIDFQEIYNTNAGNYWNSFINPGGPAIDLAYSEYEKKSVQILASAINNHSWAGLLSSLNHKLNNKLDLATGLDMRTYRGEHYREVYDLLGGDYYAGSLGTGSKNSIGENSDNRMLREGDKMYYHNDGLVRWLGGFGQLEYNHGNISAFLNLTASNSSYKRIDYFKKMDLVLGDTVLVQSLGINDTINYNGNNYTIDSPEARFTESNWENFPGFTFKLGANWNITEFSNVFFNTGVLSKAPRFNNVFNYDNQTYYNTKNEIIKAFELGYGYRSKKFSLNLNAYHTIWKNKPQSGSTVLDGGENASYNINGINSLHQGIELDFALKIHENIQYEFLTSIGNWKWNSGDTVNLYLNQQLVATDYFDARGVYVGDSPQTQIGSSINFKCDFGKNSTGYFKIKGVYFDRHFSDFEPFTLNEEKEVWQIPGYALFSLHMGNTFYLNDNNSLSIRFNVLNLLDETYISDAENNSSYVEDSPMNSDASSASIFFGLGRKLIASIEYKF